MDRHKSQQSFTLIALRTLPPDLPAGQLPGTLAQRDDSRHPLRNGCAPEQLKLDGFRLQICI